MTRQNEIRHNLLVFQSIIARLLALAALCGRASHEPRRLRAYLLRLLWPAVPMASDLIVDTGRSCGVPVVLPHPDFAGEPDSAAELLYLAWCLQALAMQLMALLYHVCGGATENIEAERLVLSLCAFRPMDVPDPAIRRGVLWADTS